MEIPKSQFGLIWKAIKWWMDANHLTPQVLSLQLAGVRPPYPPDRIARGIRDGSEQVTSDLLHYCVRVFGIVKARDTGLEDNLTDEECIGLLTAPLMKNSGQGKFQL